MTQMKIYIIENIFATKFYKKFIFIFLIAGLFSNCKKLVTVDPPSTVISGESIFSENATATSVLTGLYASLSNNAPSFIGNITSLSYAFGLSSDEFKLSSLNTSPQANAFYKNLFGQGTAITTAYGGDFWFGLYPFIFKCNDAIVGLTGSETLSPAIKQQLLGEAKFLRAYFYFYLVNLYKDVPLAITNDPKINAVLARSSESIVYQQILSDLKDAQNLLSTGYLDGSLLKNDVERVRPNKWVATALLAKVYLFMKDYANAEAQASLLINNSTLFGLAPLSNTFLKFSLGNNEAIWQLQRVTNLTSSGASEADAFTITSSGIALAGNLGIYLSDSLLNAFEAGDTRKTSWIGSIVQSGNTYYFPSKYKQIQASTNVPATEFLTLFRLGEQYLIRAEARAQLGTPGATGDLNSIRTRAGLPNYNGLTDKNSLLNAILHERRVEMFAELGNRWLDLKRMGTIDAVMNAYGSSKGVVWDSHLQLLPIPFSQLQLDPNLTQNPGY